MKEYNEDKAIYFFVCFRKEMITYSVVCYLVKT